MGRMSREEMRALAAAELKVQFIRGFYSDADAVLIDTPGFTEKRMTVKAVIEDDLAGKQDPLSEILACIADAAGNGNERCQRLIDAMASRHAEFHADDAIRSDVEDMGVEA